MDFASGGSIRTLLKPGKIEERYTQLIIRETLIGLNYLHRQEIIHRDIKSANILLTNSNRVLLCDFGIAAPLQSTNHKRSTFIGTPYWMAPEVITDGKLYDTKADIWSLGITLYEMLNGNPPFSDLTPAKVILKIPRSQPAKLEGNQFSNIVKEFLAACLIDEPNDVSHKKKKKKKKSYKTT
jgi:serine/threonine protein kinase